MALQECWSRASSLLTVTAMIGCLALLGMLQFSPAAAGELANPNRIADERFLDPDGFVAPTNEPAAGWAGSWVTSKILPPLNVPSSVDSAIRDVQIQGTGNRNNPLRRRLSEPLTENEIFVGFRLLYEPSSTGGNAVDPEFFVLWLDRTEGSDRAVHSAGVPNIGLHQADRGPHRGKNVFMVRFGSSQTAWSGAEVVPGTTYRVLARLAKSKPGERNDFDQLDLWVDPQPDNFDSPLASIQHQVGVHQVNWLGFSTGVKTEPTDNIRVGDLVLSRSWDDALAFLMEDQPVEDAANAALVWNKPVNFRKDIFPILEERCFGCHADEFPDSGYRLDVRDELLGYSTGEPLVVPGSSRRSKLIDVLITSNASERMPPGEPPLEEEEIAKLRAWIDQGFEWDDELLPTPEVKSTHWAFQPIKRPPVPEPIDRSRYRNPIDAFIQTQLHEQGLSPAERANSETLVRRVYLDVLGLPPSLAERDEFLQDQADDAYETLVEQVLASPHYGERMARHWLDLVRWGESQGFQHDIPRPFAWRYRDYVINSFNADKPYSVFLKEQLAGDELDGGDESLVATGFLAAARISGNQMDKEIQRAEVMFDITDTTASSVLGLTMECAQCHNHKFEPITQRDYYRFLAFFSKGQLTNLKLKETAEVAPEAIKEWYSPGAYNFYLSEARKLKIKPADYPTHTWGYYSPATGRDDVEVLPVVNRSPLPFSPQFLERQEGRIFVRGNPNEPGLRVEPGWPAVLGTVPSELEPTPRQALAGWLAAKENPLTARVWVNRLWQYHFGRGLVSTPSNFGTHGSEPSHPALLDWLASELMASNWSTKHIQRLILTSHTYQQSHLASSEGLQVDPDNQLLWRWQPRRLEAEAMHDSLLVSTGELNRQVGGPSVPPRAIETRKRRTLYFSQRRSELPDVMTMFDGPDGVRSCACRDVSTVGLQPLYLLNNPFVVQRAKQLADLVSAEQASPAGQIEAVFLRTLGRKPTAVELTRAQEQLVDADANAEVDLQRLVQFCHAMFNLNEYVYIP